MPLPISGGSGSLSLQGLVDTGNHHYAPLINFRDWLKSIRNDPDLRMGQRRNGQVTVINNKLVPGPFSLSARQMILERLLETQQECGERLISDVEIETIRRFWAEDLIRMHTKQEGQ